jgi:hypothetical protein
MKLTWKMGDIMVLYFQKHTMVDNGPCYSVERIAVQHSFKLQTRLIFRQVIGITGNQSLLRPPFIAVAKLLQKFGMAARRVNILLARAWQDLTLDQR